jgi:hypothetical protein
MPNVEPPEPARFGEVVWLQPFPDDLLADAIDVPAGPEARYEQTESISLAFVTALQVLPPRQLAVLILRDVLGFHASEVPGMLDSTVESVSSALKRARASLQRRHPAAVGREPPPAPGSPAEEAIVAKFVSASESADLGALVALLTGDVFISMPPTPFGYEGRAAVARFCAGLFGAGRRFDLAPTRANGPPAFGAYLRPPGRHPQRNRPLRAHPRRRPGLCHDPLRQPRAAVVRAAAIAPEPIATAPLARPSSSPAPSGPAGSRCDQPPIPSSSLTTSSLSTRPAAAMFSRR